MQLLATPSLQRLQRCPEAKLGLKRNYDMYMFAPAAHAVGQPQLELTCDTPTCDTTQVMLHFMSVPCSGKLFTTDPCQY